MIRSGFKVDVFDTGDGTSWCFEVYHRGKLVGQGQGFDRERNARKVGEEFAMYYVVSD